MPRASGLISFNTGGSSQIKRTPTHEWRSEGTYFSEEYDDSNFVDKDEIPIGLDPHIWNVKVATGKAFSILDRRESVQLSVERTSVYGAALVMPQLARTAKGALSFTALAIRAYILLMANLALQGFLLYMITTEERIMDKFGAEMKVCDFAAHMSACPGGPNCWGPGGTKISPDRLYDWTVWNTRRFVKASLIKLFPEKTAEIEEKIDPGEFGVESYYLRVVCIYIFIMGVYSDLMCSLELGMLLWYVPHKGEPWMEYSAPDASQAAQKTAKLPEWDELDHLTFKIAGMPRAWKLANVFLVWLPKIYLWTLTVDIGVVFLMETSKIEDMIINSATLAFILNIDELICSCIMPHMSTYIMERVEDFVLEDDEADTFWNHDAVAVHEEDLNWKFCSFQFISRVFPIRVIFMAVVCSVFIGKYYYDGCVRLADGSMVANDVYLPKAQTLSLRSFLFGPLPGMYEVECEEEKPVWSYSPGRPDLAFNLPAENGRGR